MMKYCFMTESNFAFKQLIKLALGTSPLLVMQILIAASPVGTTDDDDDDDDDDDAMMQ